MFHHVPPWPCSSSACWPPLGGSSLAWRHSTGCWGSKTSPAQDSSHWDTQCRHTELTGPAGRGQHWWGRWRSGRQAARPSLLPSQIFWRHSLTRNKISEIDKSFGVLSQGWNVNVNVFYYTIFFIKNIMAQQYIYFSFNKLYDHRRILSFRIIWLMIFPTIHVIIVYDRV